MMVLPDSVGVSRATGLAVRTPAAFGLAINLIRTHSRLRVLLSGMRFGRADGSVLAPDYVRLVATIGANRWMLGSWPLTLPVSRSRRYRSRNEANATRVTPVMFILIPSKRVLCFRP